jgi:hypothetical protein
VPCAAYLSTWRCNWEKENAIAHLVNGLVIAELGQTGVGEHLSDGGSEGSLAVIDMTDRANVEVGLRAVGGVRLGSSIGCILLG